MKFLVILSTIAKDSERAKDFNIVTVNQNLMESVLGELQKSDYADIKPEVDRKLKEISDMTLKK